MVKLQFLLWIGLVIFVHASKDYELGKHQNNQHLQSLLDNEDIENLMVDYQIEIRDENLKKQLILYFKNMETEDLKSLFEKNYQLINGSMRSDESVNELLEYGHYSKVVKFRIEEKTELPKEVQKLISRCTICCKKQNNSKDKSEIVFRDKNDYSCCDCLIRNKTLEYVMKQETDNKELVVFFLLSQYGEGKSRFQDSIIVPQVIADIFFLTSASINLTWNYGSDSVYSEGWQHMWHSYHIALVSHFGIQLFATFVFSFSMYSERMKKFNDWPIVTWKFGKWNFHKVMHAVVGIISIIFTVQCQSFFMVGDVINGLMAAQSMMSLWSSRNTGYYDHRYVIFTETNLALLFNPRPQDKLEVLANAWIDQGFWSYQLLALFGKIYASSNGFMAFSILKYFPNGGEEFEMPGYFIQYGLVVNFLIWLIWFIITLISVVKTKYAFDDALSFSWKLLQVGVNFGIMLCTTSVNPGTKLNFNFFSIATPIMAFYIHHVYTKYNQKESPKLRFE